MKKPFLITSICFLLNANNSFSQQNLGELEMKTEKLEKKTQEMDHKLDTLLSRVKKKGLIDFGLSVGYRQVFSIGPAGKYLAEASISPIDSTLKIELANRHSFLLSAIISTYPFKTFDMGFYANINLAAVAGSGEIASIFNQRVEGGFGLSYKFSEAFALGLGYEYVFHTRLRNYLIDNYENKKLYSNGQVITTLDKNDKSLFREDNAHAWSLKFIFYF